MTNTEDLLGALRIIAGLHAVKDVKLVHGYYLVMFENTTTNISIDAKTTTLEEIQAAIADARS